MPKTGKGTNFDSGVYSFGMPIIGTGEIMTTGDVYFVHGTDGSSANDGLTKGNPLNNITNALSKCTANQGDVIFLMPGHTEAPTATITVNKAGVSIIGLGNARNRPAITPAHTAADDTLDITAANVLIRNIRIAAGTNSGGNTVQINIGANDVAFENCVIEMGAKNLIGVTVEGSKNRWRFSDCLFLGTAANPDIAIDLEGSGQHDDWIVERCDFNFATGSSGLDLAGIKSDKTDTGVRISDCRFLGMDATALDFDSSATGIVERVSVYSTNSTVNEMIDPGDLTFFDCKVGYISLSGATIPATTASA